MCIISPVCVFVSTVSTTCVIKLVVVTKNEEEVTLLLNEKEEPVKE